MFRIGLSGIFTRPVRQFRKDGCRVPLFTVCKDMSFKETDKRNAAVPRIAIVCPIISGFGRRGFYQSQETGLGRALVNKGCEVTIYKAVPFEEREKRSDDRADASGERSDDRADASGESLTERLEPNLSIRYCPSRSIGVHGLMDVSVIDPGSDAVLVFSDTQLITGRIARWCRRNKMVFIPYVGIAHSFHHDLKARLMDVLYRMTVLPVYRSQGCTVIAKTDRARQELVGQGIDEARCVVAPVGLDLSVLKANYEQEDCTAIRARWGFERDDVIVSFIARLQPEKRPLDLIDLFAAMKHPRKRLLIVGKGPLHDAMRERIFSFDDAKDAGPDPSGKENRAALDRNSDGDERVSDPGGDRSSDRLADRITILPEVPYERMWEIHYISDYLISLRTEEIFGMAVMEAVYYKTCVLARRAPGPETILQGLPGHHLCDSDEEILDWLNRDETGHRNGNSDDEGIRNVAAAGRSDDRPDGPSFISELPHPQQSEDRIGEFTCVNTLRGASAVADASAERRDDEDADRNVADAQDPLTAARELLVRNFTWDRCADIVLGLAGNGNAADIRISRQHVV